MNDISIIPDSSFFICFLDDIGKPERLLEIINSSKFSLIIGKMISQEIRKSENFFRISEEIHQKAIVYDYYEYGEAVKVFFSESEIEKGEHEIFVISYIFSLLERPFIAIIDDMDAKKFLKNNIQHPEFIVGTIGFLELCTCSYKVFIKEVSINILMSIKESKFFVDPMIIDATIEKIRACNCD